MPKVTVEDVQQTFSLDNIEAGTVVLEQIRGYAIKQKVVLHAK